MKRSVRKRHLLCHCREWAGNKICNCFLWN